MGWVSWVDGPGSGDPGDGSGVFVATMSGGDPFVSGGGTWGLYGDGSGPRNPWGSGAAEAWADGFMGATSVVLGVVDTGVDITHPDLYLNIWLNQMEIPLALRQLLADTDADALITFRDLNTAVNAAHVTDWNANGYIDGMDLLSDARWADGADTEGNGYADDLVGWNFQADSNIPFVSATEDRHGTHVAGTIAAIGGNALGAAGVAPMAQVMVLKFMGAAGGYTDDAARALDYFTWFARNDPGQHYVATNNSWGGGSYSAALEQAILRGAMADVLFVAAAGNAASDTDAAPHFPTGYSTLAAAGFEAVISVAALTSTGGLAWFSNYGRTSVDLAAPGQGILSTTPGGGFASLSGTSMAAPHVAGALALYAAADPAATAATLRQALLDSAALTASLAGRTVTGGRLDIPAMLALLEAEAPIPIGIVVADGNLRAGQSTTVTLTFARGVTLTLASFDLTQAGGVLSSLHSANGGTTWTAVFTPDSGIERTDAVIRLLAGGYADDRGTPGAGAQTGPLTIDSRAPGAVLEIIFDDRDGDGRLDADEGATLTLRFDEAVTWLEADDLTATGDALIGPLTGDADGRVWTAAVTPAPGQAGALSIELAAGSYADLAGNAGTGAVSAVVTVDPQPVGPQPSGVVLIGSAGSDRLNGGASGDVIIGFDQDDAALGRRTLDRLKGGAGADVFVLGDARGHFYDDALADTAGRRDLGWITDFCRAEGDRIQVAAGPHVLQAAVVDGVAGVLIRLDSDGNGRAGARDEVLAFVAGATADTLDAGDLVVALPDGFVAPTVVQHVPGFSVEVAPVAESAGVLRVTIRLDSPAIGGEMAQLTVGGIGLAPVDGADFAAGVLPDMIVTFAAGESLRCIDIALCDDALFEGDEQARVTVTALDGLAGGQQGRNLTIRNDDMQDLPPQILTGTAGADVLIGRDWVFEVISGLPSGTGGDGGGGTVDRLVGGLGADHFVLGAPGDGSFYRDTGDGRLGHARIAGFDAGQGDRLLLAGQAGDYLLADMQMGLRAGLGILIDRNGNAMADAGDDLVGLVVNHSLASLGEDAFVFI